MDDKLRKKAASIRLAVFDVDGVLTDGSLVFSAQGNEFKTFNVQDGLGLVLLRKSGIEPAIITSRTSSIVEKRIASLGITRVYQGVENKQLVLKQLMEELAISSKVVAYVGDDLIDLPAMALSGFAIAVANARPQVKSFADWITLNSGGHGAVREICEMLLEAQGKLELIVQDYMKTQ